MAPDLGGWIHNFTVTDTQTHKGGYTLYKITSIVFPRSVPQALTQIVVWRRFHDVKRLHRDLKRRHKSLQLPGYLPEPIDCSFFKRFDKDVIQKRKEYILQLLDYAAQHPALYKCHAFAQFFNETTPPNKIQTLVHKAVRGLNKNLELLQDQVDFARKELEEDKKTFTIKEDKQIQHEQPTNAIEEIPTNNKHNEKNANETEEPEGEEGEDDEEESLKVEYTSNVNNHPKHFLTPMASIESDDSDYIYEAALEFSLAVQAEANLEYNEAHLRYKKGVDILLAGSKDDSNEERKFIAKAKISKYLARADDIYERFLKSQHRSVTASPKNNFQLAIDVSGNTASDSSGLYLERPWNHMAKYKVNRLLGNKVLHVTCITEPLKPSYVMKGIEKPSSNSPTQTVFLPQHVPYMVDLLAFFQSDQKIFLLLKLALGGKLIDYVHSINKGTKQLASSLSSSNPTTEVNDLVNNSKQLLQSVSNTLQVIKDLECDSKSPRKSPRRSPRKMPSFHSKIPETQLKMWAQQLLIAIHALHEKSVILSDLNMDNLLLNENGQLLLTYFYQNEGVSSDSCIHKALSPKALDEHFVAPERPLTLRSDWWSYGVILYELFLGLSFKAAHPGQIDLYGFVQYPENAEISDDAKDLLEKLLQQSPEDRLDYEKIKNHRYFEGTNWEEIKQNGYNHYTQK